MMIYCLNFNLELYKPQKVFDVLAVYRYNFRLTLNTINIHDHLYELIVTTIW